MGLGLIPLMLPCWAVPLLAAGVIAAAVAERVRLLLLGGHRLLQVVCAQAGLTALLHLAVHSQLLLAECL